MYRWLMVGVALGPTLSVAAPPARPVATQPASEDVLAPEQWRALERSLDLALPWLATQQNDDGSFRTLDPGQPAVTALCVLAFLSRGHMPGEGRYGTVIDKGIEFTLGCQHADGLLARHYPSMAMSAHNPVHTANYNHAIAGLMLSEAYGITHGTTNARIKRALGSALKWAWKRVPNPKRYAWDEGGWRYGKYRQTMDSDMSVTSWHLMFLRSCRNAGFEVPSQYIDEGLEFVRRCYEPKGPCFVYAPGERRVTRAMTGAGVLSLSLGGEHHTKMARQAGGWLLRHPFDRYNVIEFGGDAYLYGAFYSSQAMFQLGGHYWADFYPRLVDTLVRHQSTDGSWREDAGRGDLFGRAYATSLAVLTLTTPYQLLPIFQR